MLKLELGWWSSIDRKEFIFLRNQPQITLIKKNAKIINFSKFKKDCA